MKSIIGLFIVLFIVGGCSSTPRKVELKYYTSDQTARLDLPFSEAVIVGNMIYLSGQVGNAGEMKVVSGGIKAETRQVMENIQRVLEANNSSLENAVKLTIMMADMEEWGAMNEVYREFFPGNKPARSAFGTSGLALGARLEVECIAIVN